MERNLPNLSKWMEAYRPNLERAVKEKPIDYGFPLSEVPAVVDRMRAAIERGTYNHAGHALKWTCQGFGIKHTRKAIEAFLAGNESNA